MRNVAGAVFASLPQAFSVGGDPGVDESHDLFANRQPVNPGDRAEERQTSSYLVHRISSDFNLPIDVDITHAGIEIRMSQDGESIFHPRLLPRDVIELIVGIETLEALDLPNAERAFAVVDYDGLNWFS